MGGQSQNVLKGDTQGIFYKYEIQEILESEDTDDITMEYMYERNVRIVGGLGPVYMEKG